MRRSFRMMLWGALLTAAVPAGAAAQDAGWYVGVSAAAQQVRFAPFYTYYAGGEPDLYDDRATGLHVNLMAGRRVQLGPLLFGYEGSIGFNDYEWTLSIPEEPADFRYALPFTALVSAVPEVRLGQRLSAFVELGAGIGRVREIKTSPSSSAYDYRAFRPVLALGGGLRLTLLPRLGVLTHYRHQRYAGFGYDTFDPDGVRIEHVEDAPRSHALFVGLAAGL